MTSCYIAVGKASWKDQHFPTGKAPNVEEEQILCATNGIVRDKGRYCVREDVAQLQAAGKTGFTEDVPAFV